MEGGGVRNEEESEMLRSTGKVSQKCSLVMICNKPDGGLTTETGRAVA